MNVDPENLEYQTMRAIRRRDLAGIRHLVTHQVQDNDARRIIEQGLDMIDDTSTPFEVEAARILIAELVRRNIPGPSQFLINALKQHDFALVDMCLRGPLISRDGVSVLHAIWAMDDNRGPVFDIRILELLLVDAHGYDPRRDEEIDDAISAAIYSYHPGHPRMDRRVIAWGGGAGYQLPPGFRQVDPRVIMMLLRDPRVFQAADLNKALKTSVKLGVPKVVEYVLANGRNRVTRLNDLPNQGDIVGVLEVLRLSRRVNLKILIDQRPLFHKALPHHMLVAMERNLDDLAKTLLDSIAPWSSNANLRSVVMEVCSDPKRWDVTTLIGLQRLHDMFSKESYYDMVLHFATIHARADLAQAALRVGTRTTGGGRSPAAAAADPARRAELELAFAYACIQHDGNPSLVALKDMFRREGVILPDDPLATWVSKRQLLMQLLRRVTQDSLQRARGLVRFMDLPTETSRNDYHMFTTNRNWAAIAILINEDVRLDFMDMMHETERHDVIHQVVRQDFGAIQHYFNARPNQMAQLPPRTRALIFRMMHAHVRTNEHQVPTEVASWIGRFF
jgi:hypothetical protein